MNEGARKESSAKEVKDIIKLDKFLIGNVIALMILITSSSYVSFDYIQNIDLLKHPRKERVQALVHMVLYFSSVGSLFFAFLSDCAFPDYQVELGEAILSSAGGVVVVIVNFFYPMSTYTVYACLFPFMLEMVTTPNTWSFLLHQTRVINVNIEWVLSLSLLETLVLMSVFKVSSEIIRYFADNETVSHFFTLWQLFSSLSRVLTLLMVSNRVDKPKVSFIYFATVALVTFYNVRQCFRRCLGKKEEEMKFQDIDMFYTERFWAVLRIMIFFMPFGFGSMCVYVVSKNLEAYLIKSSARASLLENFYSFYFIGGSVLTFFYFFGLAPFLKETKCWTKVLRHLGVAFVLLMIALTYIGVLQAIVFSLGIRLKKGYSHSRLFNLADSEVTINSNLIDTTMMPYTMISVSGNSDWNVEIHSEKLNIAEKTTLFLKEGKSNVFAISKKGIERLPLDFDFNADMRGENPLLFLLPTSANVTLNFKNEDKVETLKTNNSTAKTFLPGKGLYEIEAVAKQKIIIEHFFDQDGIYAILILEPISEENLKIYSLKRPRVVSIYWVIPCAAILALADSLKLYVCMKLVFYQAPPQLRTMSIALNFFMVHSTNFIYLFHHVDLAEYELYVFIVLSIVIVFFAFYIYSAMKYIPYIFTGHGKL